MSTLIRRAKRNGTGFSLIEVVLALGVVAFALVAILAVFPAAFSQNRKSISDTRSAQLARMIVSTIEAQTATFTAIDCFGTTLNLATATTGTTNQLYAGYPSPSQPEITTAKNSNSIYSIELRYNNTPEVAPSVTLPAGIINQVQIRIRGLAANSTEFREFIYLFRKKG
jgi:uncharacterized protein (TIGR02598 family)